MPMSPPPPPPQPTRPTVMFNELEAQSVCRKARLARHKATVMEFSAHVEDAHANTPEAIPLPTRAELNEAASLEESSESARLAALVLDPESESHDPIADGFAALRAQSAQRKAKIRELKRTTAQCTYAQARTKVMPQGARRLREELTEELPATDEG